MLQKSLIPLRTVFMHAVRTSIEDKERTKTARKGCTLVVVLTVKCEPWLASKCSEKCVAVENNEWRNSRFTICKSYMFITMCQLKSSSYM